MAERIEEARERREKVERGEKKTGKTESEKSARPRTVRFMRVRVSVRGAAHGSTAITASRHHLYLRDTAKPSPSRIVTAQGPYSRCLALIGPPRSPASFFLRLAS